jgi:hypothetical protein
VADPDEHLAPLLDSIGDRVPTEEEAQQIVGALGIDLAALGARIQAEVDAAKARVAAHEAAALRDAPAGPPAPANDTVRPPGRKKEAPRRWVLLAVAAVTLAAALLCTAGVVAVAALDLRRPAGKAGGRRLSFQTISKVTPSAAPASLGAKREPER